MECTITTCLYCGLPGSYFVLPLSRAPGDDSAPIPLQLQIHTHQCGTYQHIDDHTGQIFRTNRSPSCRHIEQLNADMALLAVQVTEQVDAQDAAKLEAWDDELPF